MYSNIIQDHSHSISTCTNNVQESINKGNHSSDGSNLTLSLALNRNDDRTIYNSTVDRESRLTTLVS